MRFALTSGFVTALSLLGGGCVLDRTGQSATEALRREMAMQSARVANVEATFTSIDQRVSQLEELTRARGQEEIMRMETLDQLRGEVARIRGDVEVLSHEADELTLDGYSRDEDANFRIVWLEQRAMQLEKALGLEPPAAPSREEAAETLNGTPPDPELAEGDGETDTAGEGDAGTAADAADDGSGVTDPDALIKLAEEHLAGGREKAAIAVLTRFLELNPGHTREAEAQYRRAEAWFNAKEYNQAVLRFQEVIDAHKDSPWASWAMLRQGECFDAQGKSDNAKLFYEDVVRLWPKSKAAKEARTRLGK